LTEIDSQDIRLGFSKDYQDTYSELVKKAGSPFYKKEYADVFIFAIALAIYKSLPPTAIARKVSNIPLTAIGNRIWILNAVAIARSNDHKELFNNSKIYDLAERYANSGIGLLKKEVFETDGDFFSRMEDYCKRELERN
jgi:hypothetical protein